MYDYSIRLRITEVPFRHGEATVNIPLEHAAAYYRAVMGIGQISSGVSCPTTEAQNGHDGVAAAS